MREEEVDDVGMFIKASGLDIRDEIAEAVSELGVGRAFLSGRLLRGSAEVGILSGICSDILCD